MPEVDEHLSGFSAALLDWYDRHGRTLPWRAPPGQPSDPYGVWLSEVMLQQTTVAAVKAYYARFLARWPSIHDLGAADLSEVLQEWAGLGYYSRARNLHACAQAVVREFGGRFPDTEAGLRVLPGVGAYTAAAIASIAFGRRAVVVDGNIERVMARVEAIETPLPQARPRLRDAMDSVTPATRTGDFAQAVMDLGATICTPRSPCCVICPVRRFCAAAKRGDPSSLPRRSPKPERPVRGGAVFVVEDDQSRILVRNRPPKGLFGGMTELPGTEWVVGFEPSEGLNLPDGLSGLPVKLGMVEHGLTHFELRLHVFQARLVDRIPPGHRWIDPTNAANEGLPTLMMKVVRLWLDRRSVVAQPSSSASVDTD